MSILIFASKCAKHTGLVRLNKIVKHNRRYVRVVKETDLKSVGLRPRRFEPCCRRLNVFLRIRIFKGEVGLASTNASLVSFSEIRLVIRCTVSHKRKRNIVISLMTF